MFNVPTALKLHSTQADNDLLNQSLKRPVDGLDISLSTDQVRTWIINALGILLYVTELSIDR